MSLSKQESKRELVKDAKENVCNAGEGNAPQTSPPHSPDVQATSASSESAGGKKGRKLHLILMPFRILRKRYSTLIHTKFDKDDEDDTDQKPRGRPSGNVTGSGSTEPKPKPKPKPASGRWGVTRSRY